MVAIAVAIIYNPQTEILIIINYKLEKKNDDNDDDDDDLMVKSLSSSLNIFLI
mgnify:CR=1 FL=1